MKLALSEGREAVCLLCPDDEVTFKDDDPTSLERRVRDHLRLEHYRQLVTVVADGNKRTYEGPRVGRELFDG